MSASVVRRCPLPSDGRPSLDLVARPRLISLLDTAMRVPATLLRAPAGYGKTVLMEEWVRRRSVSCAWVSLCGHHSDPDWFWRDLARAVACAIDGNGDREAESGRKPSEIAGSAEGVLEFVSRLDSEMLIVLDDYQRISSDSPVHSQMEHLLRFMPSRLHVAILSRSFPRIGLARLRAGGMLLELREADLAFTDLEMKEFLAREGVSLNARDAEGVSSLLAGWPAGARMLAQVSGSDRDGELGFGRRVELAEPFVREYLEEEVLESASVGMRSFLAGASYLQRFTASLAARSLGIGEKEAAVFAGRAMDEGLFVSPSGSLDGEAAFAVHPFAARVLEKAAVAIGAPDRLSALERASSWFEERGDMDGAVAMAARARNWDYIASAVMRSWRGYYASDAMGALCAWIDLLPASYIQSHPGLCLVSALPLAANGRSEEARGALRIARQGIRHEEDEKLGQYQAARSLTCAVLGEPETAEEAGRAALAMLSESEDYLRAMVQQVLGGVLQSKDPLASRDAFREALATQRTLGMPNPLCSVFANLAALSAYMGECSDARAYAEHAMEVFPVSSHRDKPMLDMAYAAHAQASYASDDLEAARADVGYLKERDGEVHLPSAISGYLTAALMARLSGDEESEFAVVREVRSRSLAGLIAALPPLSALSAWISRGLVSARDLRAAADDLADSAPVGLLMRTLVNAAEGVQGGLPGVEAAQLAKMLDGIPAFYVRAQMFAAMAYEAEGVSSKADASMRRAFDVAQAAGLRRVFIDDASYILNAWRRVASDDPGSWAAALLKDVSSHAAPSVSREAVRSLTDREMEVIRLASDGLSVQQIADRLFLSRETAKKHLGNAYGKLGVHSKGQAVALLRQLGVL